MLSVKLVNDVELEDVKLINTTLNDRGWCKVRECLKRIGQGGVILIELVASL